jgi:SAM-dependent methyltransferase
MRLYRKSRTALLLLQWHYIRLRSRRSLPTNVGQEGPFIDPEPFIRTLLAQNPGGSFLEIGIGLTPNIERFRVMATNAIAYTACDFVHVCDMHAQRIRDAAVANVNIRFLGNSARGSYSWTLFELLQKGETFDIIYLDGHHTFYVDAPALMLAHLLLKPGGIFMLDDITWTLAFGRSVRLKSFQEWRFFRGVYDSSSQYDARQQQLPHIGIMAQTILIEQLKYSKVEQYSTPHWWALRKPA